ncbi:MULTISPECIES: DUF3078 domain-containing protein [unclassified Sphingobacterium]|uniref:DUF3078 domain-containing protein n=1 Tax=unclassified Sphingobacterium TaxID=2609468 RepID=UPI00104530ED|nr:MULTISPECIES: DUF3078 domain-containing protein [unclassified Sphingobacterium]MCS3556128.1 hypothetical protein [Sphingobacterium sp. JUb21]TCR08504.1 DUF3078 family protein [Sphingobacterium sp. JUb20]
MNKIKLLLLVLATVFINKIQAQDLVSDSTKNWKIHGENTFLINQSSFSNWAAGGVNSFAGNIVLNYDFNYKKDRWSWDNKLIATYGQTFQKETDWRKNDDRLSLNSLIGHQATEHWLYTFFLNFNTQFARGYDYTSPDKKLISEWLSPAYLSFGPGMAYKKSDNLKFNLSPAAIRIVFVNNDSLATSYGLDSGKNSRFEFGAAFDAYYKMQLMENITFENILKLYSNYLDKPKNIDVDYTANLAMKVNQWITVNAGVQLVYDDNTKLPKIENGVIVGKKSDLQMKQILGAGVTYKF